MKLAKLFQRLPLFRVHAVRAALEMSLVQAAVTLLFPLLIHTFMNLLPRMYTSRLDLGQAASISYVLYCIAFNVCSAAWWGLRWRLRPASRTRVRQFVVEMAAPCVLFLELILSLHLLQWVLGGNAAFAFLQVPASPASAGRVVDYGRIHITTLFSTTIGCSCMFFLLRALTYTLLFWNRLRQTHLRWALTHAHLLVVAIGAGIVYAIILMTIILPGFFGSPFRKGTTPLDSFFLSLLALGFVIFLAVVCMIIVLPPSALFSYFFARHMTRRIENLARATGALRAGQYAVRVQVEGTDEIARLQADFNAMAAELERTLHELQAERDNVATLLHARRELVASVSHELRTPVATVRSYLESTLSGWNDRPLPTLRQDLQVMEQQTIRLQSLINDLFTLSRAEVKRLELRCVPTNIELLVQRIVATISPVAWHSSRVEVIADIVRAEPPFPLALIDESRLEQVLQNLLHNGIRHTSPGGIVVVSASSDAQTVLLQVKDTGDGIAEEELPRIWERFYRTTNSRTQPGTGLGLAIVKELTEAMNGSVHVESVAGQGTCFTLCLPRVPDTPALCSDREETELPRLQRVIY